MQLAARKCVPCEGGVEPLDQAGEERCLKLLEGWEINREGEHRLLKTWEFPNFAQAVGFVNRIADVAEAEGHHPNMRVYGWNKVEIEINTHAIGGLHENDFILAAKIEQVR